METLSAVSFAAELFASIPMGLACDAMQPRLLMTGGAVVGAIAVFLFAVLGFFIFFLSRLLAGSCDSIGGQTDPCRSYFAVMYLG